MSTTSNPTGGAPTPDAAPPVGVISLGSNDLHLLVATTDGAGAWVELHNQAIMAELGVALHDGVAPASALCLALNHLDTLVTASRAAGAAEVFILATEVIREARNGQALLDLAAATLGAKAFLLTGDEEAALDYRWASFPTPPQQMTLVVDSGGASTQVILGDGPTPTFITSTPIGAGSLTHEYIHHDPPKSRELRALQERIATALNDLPTDAPRPGESAEPPTAAVIIGGSADHLARFTAHPKRLTVSRQELDHALDALQSKPAAEVAQKFKLPVERARLLPAGASILSATLAHYGCVEAQIRPNGIRGGFVISYARDGARWRKRLTAR